MNELENEENEVEAEKKSEPKKDTIKSGTIENVKEPFEKKKSEGSYEAYEEEKYDEYEDEPRNEERPETSSHSRRGEPEPDFN